MRKRNHLNYAALSQAKCLCDRIRPALDAAEILAVSVSALRVRIPAAEA
ncbi:MAG: hypothetical protein SOW84_00480 [Candidatus Faecousia sp.]|nr:hypothetical protein [Candidatus Faecousia sp.]